MNHFSPLLHNSLRRPAALLEVEVRHSAAAVVRSSLPLAAAFRGNRCCSRQKRSRVAGHWRRGSGRSSSRALVAVSARYVCTQMARRRGLWKQWVHVCSPTVVTSSSATAENIEITLKKEKRGEKK